MRDDDLPRRCAGRGAASFSGHELSGSPDSEVGANRRRLILVLGHLLVDVIETSGRRSAVDRPKPSTADDAPAARHRVQPPQRLLGAEETSRLAASDLAVGVRAHHGRAASQADGRGGGACALQPCIRVSGLLRGSRGAIRLQAQSTRSGPARSDREDDAAPAPDGPARDGASTEVIANILVLNRRPRYAPTGVLRERGAAG